VEVTSLHVDSALLITSSRQGRVHLYQLSTDSKFSGTFYFTIPFSPRQV
jgi:hypothetical protein